MIYNTPLINTLKNYIDKEKIFMSMPGHKQGRIIHQEIKDLILKFDLTEVSETDNLYNPKGCIKEAQEKLSKAYGSIKSYFLVNGSSGGIHAMITSVCNPEDKLIVDRNCHSSVIAGLIHTGVKPIYVYPEIINRMQISGGINVSLIEQALKDNPDAKGVLITYPTYYGICSDIEKIGDIVHKYNKILLVDEAHGAHFNFCDKLPISAIKAGADICVQSAHKTLPALTQSAYMHIGTNRINISRLENSLRLYQSSSPSYILMALLDFARDFMEREGKVRINDIIDYVNSIRKEINKIGHVYCGDDKLIDNNFVNNIDYTRLVINFNELFMSGYEVADILNREHNIEVEMADVNNIVCIISVADDYNTINSLKEAIKKIYPNCFSKGINEIYTQNILLDNCILPREAFYCKHQNLKFDESIGKISGNTVFAFPPGVPIICPGEIINKEVVEYIKMLMRAGGKIIGLNDDNINVVK
jgi:lysine decarboxylase